MEISTWYVRKGVEGVELSEACFEGRIRFFLRGYLMRSTAWAVPALLRAAKQ